MYHVLLTDTAKEISVKAFWSFRTADSSTPSYLWSSSKSKDAIFPKEVLKSVQYHGEQLSQGLAWGSQKERWLSFSFTSRSLTLLLSTSVQSLCPCLHLHCKGSWQPFFFFFRLNGEAVGKVCSYGESWRGNECLSQHLFAGLFHASQPGSVINPEYPAFPADPSPHRAAAVHWHASQTADYQQWVWKWCTHQSWKCIQMLSVSLFFFFYFFHLYFLSCSDLIQHFW